MAELKTRPTQKSVTAFLDALEDDRKKDCKAIAKWMRAATGKRATMWGSSIVGFGKYRYTNTAGQAEWMMMGFSPRKQAITLYIMNGFPSTRR